MSINQLKLIPNAVAKALTGTKERAHITPVINPVLKSLHLLLAATPISLSIDF